MTEKTSATTKWAIWLEIKVPGLPKDIYGKVKNARTGGEARALAQAHLNIARLSPTVRVETTGELFSRLFGKTRG